MARGNAPRALNLAPLATVVAAWLAAIPGLKHGVRRALAGVLLGGLLAQPGSAQDARLPDTVARALQQAQVPHAAVAVLVQEADGNRPALQLNPRQAFNPASVMKLLTTFAGLEILGPAHTWKTEAYVAGPMAGGTLAGDLHLKGSGDPRLTQEQVWMLLRQLRGRGLREIQGDLVLDRSRFDTRGQDDFRFDGQGLRPYNVGPDALLTAFKSLRLTLTPDPAGGRVAVISDPLPSNLTLENRLTLGDGPCRDLRQMVRPQFHPEGDGGRLVLAGYLATACGEQNWQVAPMQAAPFTYGLVRQLWQELGGTLAGTWRDGPTPDGMTPLASVESPPLAELIRDINKWSNNAMARQLFLSLGARNGQPAGAPEADRAIREWLARRGMNMPELVLENGAGLSRLERISADSLARLLAAAWRSPLMPEYLASLPLAGVDGTARKRLAASPVAGRARIKTGTLDGVRALGGYVHDRTGKAWIVVFMANHPNAPAAQAAQDALLEWVFEGPR